MKKLYACDNCGYVFVVESPERRCPDCGSLVIREAFQQEKEEYYNRSGYTTTE